MPTRLLLEGRDIEELLARVREEHGANARIVSAERIRSGGVGGFFAKQRFEVAVEIDLDAPPGPIELPAGTAAELAADAAATSAPGTEQDEDVSKATGAAAPMGRRFRRSERDKVVAKPHPVAAATTAAGSTAAGTTAASSANQSAATTVAPAASAAAARSATPPVSPGVPWTAAAERAVGFEGLDPAMLLALQVEDHAERVHIGRDPSRSLGAAATVVSLSTRIPDAEAGQSAATTRLAGETVARLAAQPADRQQRQDRADRDDHADSSPQRRVLTPVGPGVRPATFPVVTRLDRLPAVPADAGPPAAPAALAAVPAAIAAPRPVATATPSERDQPAAPTSAAPVAAAPEPPRAPRAAGEVLVVVGEAGAAYRVACGLAESLRLPAARVLVASPDPVIPGLAAARRITDPVAARSAGAKLAGGNAAAIVVVDAPAAAAAEPETADWIHEVVRSLAGTAVWAAVDATRRPGDLARWLAALGPVDAVAAYNVAVTDSPDDLAALPAPVALLDGRRATAAAWRAVHAALGSAAQHPAHASPPEEES